VLLKPQGAHPIDLRGSTLRNHSIRDGRLRAMLPSVVASALTATAPEAA